MTKEQELQQKLNLIVEQDMYKYGCQYLADHPEKPFNILNYYSENPKTLIVWDIENRLTQTFSRNIKEENLIGKPITLQLIINALKINFSNIFDEYPKIEISENYYVICFGKHEIHVGMNNNELIEETLISLYEIFKIK